MCGKIPSSSPVRNTTGNSRPFAVCSVISVTERVVAVSLVHVGDERDRLEERLHAGQARAAARVGLVDAGDRDERGRVAGVEVRVELAGDADELGQVLDAALRLDRALGLELGEVAGAWRGSPRARRTRRPPRPSASSSSITSSRSRMPPSALPVTPGRGAVAQRLAERAGPRPARTPRPCARSCRRRRASGTLTMRFQPTSSSGFTSERRYASASFTSRRS